MQTRDDIREKPFVCIVFSNIKIVPITSYCNIAYWILTDISVVLINMIIKVILCFPKKLETNCVITTVVYKQSYFVSCLCIKRGIFEDIFPSRV